MSNTSSKKGYDNNQINTMSVYLNDDKRLEIPPTKSSAKSMEFSYVVENPMVLGEVQSHSFKKEKGVIFRVNDEGEKLKPIDKEKYDRISKLRQEKVNEEEKAKVKKTTRKNKTIEEKEEANEVEEKPKRTRKTTSVDKVADSKTKKTTTTRKPKAEIEEKATKKTTKTATKTNKVAETKPKTTTRKRTTNNKGDREDR